MFWLQVKFFSARVYLVIVVDGKRWVMYKQWRIQANMRLRNVSSLVCGFMKKNELAKRRKKSGENLFLRFNEAAPCEANHNVRQLAVVLLKKKIFQLFGWILLNNWRERSSVSSEWSLPKCSGGQTDGHGGDFNCAQKMMVHIPKC